MRLSGAKNDLDTKCSVAKSTDHLTSEENTILSSDEQGRLQCEMSGPVIMPESSGNPCHTNPRSPHRASPNKRKVRKTKSRNHPCISVKDLISNDEGMVDMKKVMDLKVHN